MFEREAGPGARAQGGTLDMHAGLGQLALERAGLLERFRAVARPEGQESRILDPAARVVRHRLPAPEEEANPEIDRGELRRLMLEPLAPGTVRWGSGVDRVEAVSGGGAGSS
ncbi:MAG TPA: hypothetical protein VIA06_16970 [Candidatus Dormibacteraeota bacterium]|nr:hypothetical protein [Candidatus Dormibacteraeota bacterium]